METYTFVINVDLNLGSKKSKGRNEWFVVVYRQGNTLQEAVDKINEDFCNPLIVFAAPGNVEILKGDTLSMLSFDPNTPYNLMEIR